MIYTFFSIVCGLIAFVFFIGAHRSAKMGFEIEAITRLLYCLIYLFFSALVKWQGLINVIHVVCEQ